jgi:hypothetical protein
MSGVVYNAPAGPRNPSADPRDQFPRPRINATGARNTRLTPREPQRQGNSTAISSTNLGRTADSGFRPFAQSHYYLPDPNPTIIFLIPIPRFFFLIPIPSLPS